MWKVLNTITRNMPALPHAGKGVYIQGWFSDNSTGGGWLGLTGFRTYYPKYSTLAYWIFQAERIWEMGGTRRTFWTSPEAGHKTLLWGVFLILGVSEHASLRPQEENNNKKDHQLSHFLHTFPFFLKPSIKPLRFQPHLQVFISLWRLLCHIKFIFNNLYVFLLLIHLLL